MSAADADAVTVTTVVAVNPATAFAVFVEDVELWWRRGPRFRAGAGAMRFDAGPRGRLLEVGAGPGGADDEVGRVRVWEPPRRLVLAWRPGAFAPGPVTEVEVRFDPDAGGTRVTIEHRGWDAIPAGHPARDGLTGGAFAGVVGLMWADLLTGLRGRAAARAGAGS